MRKCRLANLDLWDLRDPRRWLGGLLILLLPAVAQAHAGGTQTLAG